MTTDYKAGRQHAHLQMSDAEFSRRLGAIEDAFGSDWLTTGDGALPKLWQRRDGFAINQLCLLGDAIAGFNAIDPKWVNEHVRHIKGNDANARRGSMFELLGANLFRMPPQRVTPTKRNNPGYDLLLTMPDAATADISLKSYGTSTHEMTFRQQAGRTEDAVRALWSGHGAGGVLFAIANTYPSTADWDGLRSAIPTPPPDKETTLGIWAVKLGSLPPNYAPYSRERISYQVFVASPFHANESKNLSDKFDTAFANAEKHATEANDSVRVVLMRVPETMSLLACDA